MQILKHSGKYLFFQEDIIAAQKRLEKGHYKLDYDVMSGQVWLVDGKNFSFPEKIYDDSADMRGMIDKTYSVTDRNLGVFLTGNKGQGKSLTLALLCKELSEKYNLPIIEIDRRIDKNVDFISFLKNIDQDFILLIDEFEKLFDAYANNESGDHDQSVFLTYMNGASASKTKVVFLLASNGLINEFMNNRPSRIQFKREYDELSEDLFYQIVNDRLINKEYQNDLEENVSLLNLNIDTLISIIDAINLHNRPFSSFKDYFNYRSEGYTYDVYKIVGDKKPILYTTLRVDKKPRMTDSYIAHHRVHRVIKNNPKEEILFETAPEDIEDAEGNPTGKKNKVIIRLAYVNPVSMKELVV